MNARWLLEKVSAVAKNVEIPADYARKTAVLDIEDILASEALLLFTVGDEDFPAFSIDALARGGRHFEAGLAYALGKKVIGLKVEETRDFSDWGKAFFDYIAKDTDDLLNYFKSKK